MLPFVASAVFEPGFIGLALKIASIALLASWLSLQNAISLTSEIASFLYEPFLYYLAVCGVGTSVVIFLGWRYDIKKQRAKDLARTRSAD